MMLKVGITGNIGSGKTTVCNLFHVLGIPIYNADKEAKWISENDEEVKNKIIELLGIDAFDSNLKLNKRWIANKIFNDDLLLQKYNAIIHPAVQIYFNDWFHQQQRAPYVLKESAILFESKNHLLCDKIIYVAARLELRKQRVLKRDQIDENIFLQRSKHQLLDEEKMIKSDFIIDNNEELLLIDQVVQIHQELIQI